jgi:hypothetical protein
MRISLRTVVLSLAMGTAAAPVLADPVVLTVSGEIGRVNRGPVDPFLDAMLAKHEIAFDSAYGFTYAELGALPQHSLTVQFDNWPRAVTVTGPTLLDVLAAVEARGQTVTTLALDGYAPELAADDVATGRFILGIAADGVPLAVGGRGPVWVVVPRPEATGSDPVTDDIATWATYHLDVR